MADPGLLRLLWAAIEEMQSQDLLTLTDTALVAILLQQLSKRVLLSGEEVCHLYAYIGSRIALIRDTADARQTNNLSVTIH